jgi:hypothetical protein
VCARGRPRPGIKLRAYARRAAPSPLLGHGPGVLCGDPPLEDCLIAHHPPGRVLCSGGHPNWGGRGGTVKCLRRRLERPPEGGCGLFVVRVVGGAVRNECAAYGAG